MEEQATAMLDERGQALAPVPPMVLVNGEPRADVFPLSIDHAGLLGECRALFGLEREAAGWTDSEHDRVAALAGGAVVVLQPVALAGGDSRMLVLFSGRFARSATKVSDRTDRLDIVAECDWSRRLSMHPEGLADDATLADAIGALDQTLGGIDVTLLDPDRLAPSFGPVSRSAVTVGGVLRVLVERHGLVVQQYHGWDGRRVNTALSARPLAHARALPMAYQGLAGASERQTRRDTAGAVKLIGRAAPQVVESTFELQPGWDPNDEGLPDSEYGKTTSTDFDAVASVFRLWALNEDGAFAGPVFDLASFFGADGPIAPQALRFADALTHDSMGQSVGVVVEYSVDAGNQWQRYPGTVVNQRSHAAVYIDDDVLPAEYFTAAKAGAVRVRVTASLTSLLPTEFVRWAGNPFFGVHSVERFDLADRYRWRRIDQASKYALDVTSGQRTSDACDDRPQLRLWLAQRSQTATAFERSGSLSMSGLAFGLRVGDGFHDPAAKSELALTRIEHDWLSHQTRVRYETIGVSA